MHETKPTLTLTDLSTIFHVTKSPLRSHIEANGLKDQLIKHHHMIKDGYKYLFDNEALLKIALTFKGKISNRKSKSSNRGISKATSNHIFKDISTVNHKLDLIINHLHINY